MTTRRRVQRRPAFVVGLLALALKLPTVALAGETTSRPAAGATGISLGHLGLSMEEFNAGPRDSTVNVDHR